MQRIKRQQTDTIQNHNGNKKRKLQNQIITNKSIFEDLANETVYEIFEYLDIHDAYEGFFNLNKRFQNLFLNSNLPIQINISTISKSKFEHYHKNIILPNRHRINILRLSNPFTVDIVFSPPRIITQFIQLESLILDNINTKYLKNILKHSILLPKLHSLVLNLVNQIGDLTQMFVDIFRLSKLKSCKITYVMKCSGIPSLRFLDEYRGSPIEHLVINSAFSYDSLDDLLFRLPKLRHLSMNCFHQSYYFNINPSRNALKDLKYVSLRMCGVDFSELEKLIKCYFRHVEVFCLTVGYNPTYLDAKRWEEIIVPYMPNLRTFDIDYRGSIDDNNRIAYHDLINQFNSSFWIEKKWFFTHQHDRQLKMGINRGHFYSLHPYRRKDHEFYSEFGQQISSHVQKTNLTSVKQVHVLMEEITDSCVNFFPNATELTIKSYFGTSDNSISVPLNRIVPLKQITKLCMESYELSFEQIIELIRFTPNLHTLKLDGSYNCETSLELIQQSDNFQYVSHTNKIKDLELFTLYRLEEIPLYVDLFRQVEYLKTGVNRKEIGSILRYFLSKNSNETRHLLLLCITKIPKKICLRELDMLIESEKLLDNYFIKFVNRNLYLWW